MAANRELVSAVFYDERAANAALRAVKYLEDAGSRGILDAAIIRKDDAGQYHIRYSSDISGPLAQRRGGFFDAVLGSVVAELSSATGARPGPSASPVVAQAREFAIDFQHSSEFIDTLGEALGAGSTAVLALVEYRLVDRAERELLAQDGRVTRAPLRDGVESEYIALVSRMRSTTKTKPQRHEESEEHKDF